MTTQQSKKEKKEIPDHVAERAIAFFMSDNGKEISNATADRLKSYAQNKEIMGGIDHLTNVFEIKHGNDVVLFLSDYDTKDKTKVRKMKTSILKNQHRSFI